jgi:tetratricopeptide (TPR) repeat protein
MPRLYPSTFLAVALFATAVGAQTLAPEESADALFSRGLERHQAGDILGAVEAYREALAKDPNRIDARSNLGAAYVWLGRYENAVEEYRKALATDPEQTKVRFNLALALYKAALPGDAAVELEKVIAKEPKNNAALLLLADCELQLGQDGRVVTLLSPHEGELKGDRLFNYLLGNALLHTDELLRGQILIDRLFQGGDSAEARLLLGAAHMQKHDPQNALTEFEKALALNPKLPTLHSLYGRALMNRGRRPEAIEAFRGELETNANDFDSNLYLGLLLKDENVLEEAYDHLKRAERQRPQDVRVLYGLGSLHLAAGRVAEAQTVLEAVTTQTPDYLQAHVLLATVYYRQKKKDQGDREREIAEGLRQKQQAKEPGSADELGPAYRGDDVPKDAPPPAAPKAPGVQ